MQRLGKAQPLAKPRRCAYIHIYIIYIYIYMFCVCYIYIYMQLYAVI